MGYVTYLCRELKNINMKKELKKGEIKLAVTDNSREKIKAILEMFGEKVCSSDTLTGHKYIMLEALTNRWCGHNSIRNILVKPKRLKAILANEKLKAGDYVVLGKGTIVVKVDGFSNGLFSVKKGIFKKTLSKSPVFNFVAEEFKRYATKEEIEILEGGEINGWYEDSTCPNWLAYYDFKSNKRYGFTVNRSWFQDSYLHFFNKNNITTSEKYVERSLINEAKKRGLVEGATIKSPWIKGDASLFPLGNKYKLYDNEFTVLGNGRTYTIFKDGVWAEFVEVDKFAELKEAYNNGDSIEFKNILGDWCDTIYPVWNSNKEYRIKPEEPIKVGDVCKFCDDDDESVYEVGSVSRIDDFLIPYQSTSGLWYTNAKKLTKEEAIDLLFNKK